MSALYIVFLVCVIILIATLSIFAYISNDKNSKRIRNSYIKFIGWGSSMKFICDPKKNIACRSKKHCHENGGTCHHTKYYNYAFVFNDDDIE